MKLYLLGALALSGAQAVSLASDTSVIATIYGLADYTYTLTDDCFSAGPATTLGLNNIYYQYYTFTLAQATIAYPTSPSPHPKWTLTGCRHAHVYNFMAQPWVTSPASSTDGLLDSVVAYGYKMSGDSATACTASTVVTGTLYSSTTNIFTGARYQNANLILSPMGATASTIIYPLYAQLSNTGDLNSVFVAADATALTPAIDGVRVDSASNGYWDFLQSGKFAAQTIYGRGGGATGGPCGWWVAYAFEAPFFGSTTGTDIVAKAYVAALANPGVTVSMWTDNSMMTTLASTVLVGLASLLY